MVECGRSNLRESGATPRYRKEPRDLGEENLEQLTLQSTEEGYVEAWEDLKPIKSIIAKHTEMNDSFAYRIYLKPRNLPSSVKKEDRRKWAEHEEYHNTEFFPTVYWSGNGEHGPEAMEVKDRYGRFQLSIPEWPSKIPTDIEFQISKKIYQMREFITVDEDFDRRFVETRETGQELFQAVKYWIIYHVDIEDWVASMIALWCLTTFFYKTFWAFPYLRLNAERGSGKSQCLKMIALLSAMGQYVENPSGPSLFRGIDALHCVLAIDDAENLSKTDQQDLISHLNTGYEYGVKVWRINTENSMALDRFETYAPKAFASIEQMSPVLESRCLRVPILRSKDPTKYTNRTPYAMRSTLDEINESLVFWSIKKGPEFVRGATGSGVQEEFKPLFEGLPPRLHQLMTPLLVMYKFLDLDNPPPGTGHKSERENLEKIIEYQGGQHKESTTNDMDQRVLIALFDCVVSGTIDITTKGIQNEMGLETEEEQKRYNAWRIGRCLKRYNLNDGSRKVNGTTQYLPKKSLTERMEIIKDILDRYSIDISDYEPRGPVQMELGTTGGD